MNFIKFATIVLVVYALYFTVMLLLDFAKQKRKSLSLASSNNTNAFQVEDPQDVKELGEISVEQKEKISNAALEINREKEDEAKRVLHDIGIEPYGTNGLPVNPDNLMTVIKNSL